MFLCLFSCNQSKDNSAEEYSGTYKLLAKDSIEAGDSCDAMFIIKVDTFENQKGYFPTYVKKQLIFHPENGSTITLPTDSSYFMVRFDSYKCVVCSASSDLVFLSPYGDSLLKLNKITGEILGTSEFYTVGMSAFKDQFLECINGKIILKLKYELYIYDQNLNLIYDYYESECAEEKKDMIEDSSATGLILSDDYFLFDVEYSLEKDSNLIITGTYRNLHDLVEGRITDVEKKSIFKLNSN